MTRFSSRLLARWQSVRFSLLLVAAKVTRRNPTLSDRLRISGLLRLSLADAARKSGRGSLVRMPVMGVLMDLDPCEYMQGIAIVSGAYERNEALAFLRLLSPGDIVVDVGANIGQFSLLAAHAIGPLGRVHSFEPFPSVYSRLQSHVLAGPFRDTIRTFNLGLSDQKGTVTLWGSDELRIHGARNDGLTSAFSDSLRSTIVGEMRIDRWDSLVGGRVDAVKLDCEGSELLALRGMEETLQKHRPRLLIEMNPATFEAAGYDSIVLLSYLEGFAYTFYDVGREGTLTPVSPKDKDRDRSWTLVAISNSPPEE